MKLICFIVNFLEIACLETNKMCENGSLVKMHLLEKMNWNFAKLTSNTIAFVGWLFFVCLFLMCYVLFSMDDTQGFVLNSYF